MGGAAVRVIEDPPLAWAVNRAVRLVDEAGQTIRVPMVTTGPSLVAIHALLHHRPVAIICHEKTVQIEMKASCTTRAFDLRHQAADAG